MFAVILFWESFEKSQKLEPAKILCHTVGLFSRFTYIKHEIILEKPLQELFIHEQKTQITIWVNCAALWEGLNGVNR